MTTMTHRIRWFAAGLLTALGGVPSGWAQAPAKIDIAKMRPAGLLVDSYSYMSPPYNAYYFHHIDELGFRLDWVKRSGPITPLVTAQGRALPTTLSGAHGEIDLERYFVHNQVTGFLVLHRDTVLLERYFHGADRRSRFVSQSVGKSVLSILVGVAVDEGKIQSVDDPIVKYLPELESSGYRDATIKNVLQMATGVDYSEDYTDPTSGAAMIGSALVSGKPSFSAFVKSMKPTSVRPGTTFQYQSVNSQALGLLVARVTGMPLNRWAEHALWSKVGAESDAFFYQAKSQPETCTFACYNATLRDYARIGLMMLNGGESDGRRVVSASWVRQSVTPDADYLRPAPATASTPPKFGYGYQWWVPPGPDGAFMAIGIYGQAIYVNPARQMVIVQTSAWPAPIGSQGLNAERFETFEAIAAAR